MGTQVVSPSHANGSFTYQRSATEPDDKLIALHDMINKLRMKYGNKKVKKGGKKDLWMPV